MLSRYSNNTSVTQFLFLTSLLRLGIAAETHATVKDIQKLLIHHGDTLSKQGENQTSGPLIPNNDIVGQIINILNCGSFPNLPNSHLNYSLDYDAKRLILFQECDRYFNTTQKPDSLQVECKYKRWIFNKIDCQKTTCPPLNAPPGGDISTNDNTYNTTVYFWCGRGFSINGTDKVTCEENALWNFPPPTCHVSHCRPLSSPRHGFVSSQKEIAVNETVKFSCRNEYNLIGDAVLQCDNDGRWNTSAPICKKMCIVPDTKNQSEGIRLVPKFKYLSAGSLVQQGQRVVFTCKQGYMGSSGLSTCIGRLWVPPIRCRKICTPIEIDNGTYIWSNDSSSIEYSCQPGYQLVGQRKLSCTSNFTWDNEAPVCTKMCTLPELYDVLSFRNKTTYEIIPFGTQIINGTEVYSICRSNTSDTVVECSNGVLSPFPCVSIRQLYGKLEILYNGNWCSICQTTFDVCGRFGYKSYNYAISCYSCYQLDEQNFKKYNKIVLYQRYGRYNNCVRCL